MKLYVSLAGLCAALLPIVPSQAQTTPAETLPVPSAESFTPRKTMFKLGAGFDRGFALGGNTGLALPITLGMERHLNSKFSIYGNIMASVRIARFKSAYQRRLPILERGILAVGGRYYYNQVGRMKRGYAVGPFVGNYLALQASTDASPYYSYNSFDSNLRYDYSAISALWGMQRRLGNFFVYDLSAGVGIYNPGSYKFYYDPSTNMQIVSYKRRPALLPELSVRLSWAH